MSCVGRSFLPLTGLIERFLRWAKIGLKYQMCILKALLVPKLLYFLSKMMPSGVETGSVYGKNVSAQCVNGNRLKMARCARVSKSTSGLRRRMQTNSKYTRALFLLSLCPPKESRHSFVVK